MPFFLTVEIPLAGDDRLSAAAEAFSVIQKIKENHPNETHKMVNKVGPKPRKIKSEATSATIVTSEDDSDN